MAMEAVKALSIIAVVTVIIFLLALWIAGSISIFVFQVAVVFGAGEIATLLIQWLLGFIAPRPEG